MGLHRSDSNATRLRLSGAPPQIGVKTAKNIPKSTLLDSNSMSEPSPVQQRTVRWAASSNHGIVFDDTWKLVDDLEVLIKRLRTNQMKDSKGKAENSDVYSDPGWSRELGPSTEMSKQIPTDVRPHFRAGNCYYVVGRYNEGKDEFVLALDVAEAGGNQWAYLFPQIHVNLWISLKAEGMVISACEHYPEAAILCPTHFRAFKLLGSALLGVGGSKAAVKALEEAIYLKNDYADAHYDLVLALHAMGNNDNAVKEFQKAVDLKPGHVDALYNLGGLYMDMGRYQGASEVYVRVLGLW
ncbi:putative tetratricopeptide-like helical domain superfamily, acetyltransferase A, auxiliary subunit [Helianthus annuus]|uniref:Putative tetratricopeptide-like helical domain-containing protein n=1 Tax=Helianthus annuus TaxID=4232 RepID=A0A251SX88_HELAN|nr:putative tetratricopeptide-like helical domain superfamily, acetyltransferase A, auxiliary subunit [Helianthus annuus]